MPITIYEAPEPLTEASFNSAPRLIASDASRQLAHDLVRYCRDEISGRSFLVSGHRGAGKTVLVAYALQEALSASYGETPSLQPLFIPLHGPNLLPNFKPPGKWRAGKEGDSEVQTALKQITLGLHRALAKEMVRSFRERIAEQVGLRFRQNKLRGERWLNNAVELAAQLEVELYECPAPSRLREFWARAGFLNTGALRRKQQFRDPVSAAEAGLRELVALSGACEAYRRISGTFTQEEKRLDADESKTERSTSASTPGKEVYGPLFSVLTGALVGAGLNASTADPYTATIAGILTAIASAAVMKYSNTRSRARSVSRQYTFLYDLSVATLDRLLPLLVERVRAAGLAPVFVVDELDKVDDLSKRMIGMVDHLKKFVAENAFFVFITDRSYYESFRYRVATEPFPPEHTYFGRQLYIVFRPREFHAYVKSIVELPTPNAQTTNSSAAASSSAAADAADYPLLSYILLHRSRMHPIDLRREIGTLRGADGNVKLRSGLVRTSRAFQFDLRIQLAIEHVLNSNEDLANMLEQDPEFRRLTNDAFYSLSRQWLATPEDWVDMRPHASHALRHYLVNRMGSDRLTSAALATAPSSTQHSAASPAPPAPLDLERVSPTDNQFLFECLRDIAELLASDAAFRDQLKRWNAKLEVNDEKRIPQPVLDALDAMPFDLLQRDLAEPGRYQWNFYSSGRPRTPVARQRVNLIGEHAGWPASMQFIRDFGLALDELSP
ncbi:MAG: hypothetical protein ABJB66_13420 [Gemmatimonadaceae bacterium]